MTTTTLNAIHQHLPCANGWDTLLTYLNKTGPDDEPLPLVTILDSNGLDDALWALRAVDRDYARMRRYAVWCARQVQHLLVDSHALHVLDVAERHADGLVSDDDLRVARGAVGMRAKYPGKAAVEVAQKAAWSAAWDVAWSAAWDAAWSAARAAALETGWDTGWYQAPDGSWHLAQNPVEDAMRERQAMLFRKVFGEREVGR